jgi:hypothetical protein
MTVRDFAGRRILEGTSDAGKSSDFPRILGQYFEDWSVVPVAIVCETASWLEFNFHLWVDSRLKASSLRVWLENVLNKRDFQKVMSLIRLVEQSGGWNVCCLQLPPGRR